MGLSYVSVLPDHDMPSQVRFLLLYRGHDAGASFLGRVHFRVSYQCMKLLILVLSKNSAEFGVTVAAIPVVLALLALCGYAVQREIKWSGSAADSFVHVSLTKPTGSCRYLWL